MTVGQKIANYRKISRLSQSALAKKSDLTAPAINQYESGKRIPDLKSFVAVCKSLGVSMDKFMEGISI